jgi:hypothetical protein
MAPADHSHDCTVCGKHEADIRTNKEKTADLQHETDTCQANQETRIKELHKRVNGKVSMSLFLALITILAIILGGLFTIGLQAGTKVTIVETQLSAIQGTMNEIKTDVKAHLQEKH